jgi:hypothetical protein
MTVETAAREILQGQRMPPEEIRAVLATDDPLLVRRLLELHRERLGEWVEEQRRLVASIERSLAGEPGRRSRAPSEDLEMHFPATVGGVRDADGSPVNAPM